MTYTELTALHTDDTATYKGYTQEQLQHMFGIIADEDDWKAPVEELQLANELLGVAAAAVEFFTAGPLFITHTFGSVSVCRFDGYRAGPAN